jgi:large subunit ribosomal protein LP0
VCTAGKKVKASEAALLKKLNLKPFAYGMKIGGVYIDGSILPQAVLDVDPSQLVTKFQNGIKNIAGLSLASGYPISATIPLIIANSFRNIAALSIESGYDFVIIFRFKIKELDNLPANGGGTSAPSAPVKEEKKADKKAEKPPKVE